MKLTQKTFTEIAETSAEILVEITHAYTGTRPDYVKFLAIDLDYKTIDLEVKLRSAKIPISMKLNFFLALKHKYSI